jgi:SAM-dependent methyltransferase
VATREQLSEHELCPPELLRGQEEAFARDVDRLQARAPEFVTVACPACGADEPQPAWEKHGFQWVTCPRCATIYMSPRPSPAVMAAYYASSENYRYWAEHIFPASEASRREKVNRPWLDRILGYTTFYDVPRDLLVEIGPGFGTFAGLARERFDRVVGIEPTPEMAQACRDHGIEVIEKPIEEVGDDEVTGADVACAFEVIEHLFEPRVFVERCARFLRPGGLLVLSCPNGQGFDIQTLGPVSLAVDPEHVNLFNPVSLTRLVETCGFGDVEVSTPGRLDAEFVHDAVADGKFDLSGVPFLRRVLVDEWDRLGWPFQQFLAEHGLSSHMWLAARLPG